jgi:hypothetical protein
VLIADGLMMAVPWLASITSSETITVLAAVGVYAAVPGGIVIVQYWRTICGFLLAVPLVTQYEIEAGEGSVAR